MRSVCLFNNKGGVGKTTLTCNIAAHLALKYEKKVLVVDCDPQCNATQLILSEGRVNRLYRSRDTKTKTGTIIDVLRPLQVGEASINERVLALPAAENRFGVDIIPGHPRLSILEDILSQSWSDAAAGKIGGVRRSNWCAALTSHLDNEYDVTFFDIGPSLGSLNRSVLLGIEHFMSPVGADLFSIFGIRNIAAWLKQWLKDYSVGMGLAEDSSPGILAEYKIQDTPAIKKGFVGYTVQQYITKSKQGERRATIAYEKILREIPGEIEDALGKYYSPSVNSETVHLGDVPHMYSLVPLAQSANTPIRSLTYNDGLAGSQFKQAEKYATNLDVIVQDLATNLELGIGS